MCKYSDALLTIIYNPKQDVIKIVFIQFDFLNSTHTKINKLNKRKRKQFLEWLCNGCPFWGVQSDIAIIKVNLLNLNNFVQYYNIRQAYVEVDGIFKIFTFIRPKSFLLFCWNFFWPFLEHILSPPIKPIMEGPWMMIHTKHQCWILINNMILVQLKIFKMYTTLRHNFQTLLTWLKEHVPD